MGQVSSVLRRGENCYFHWCPACAKMHPLPDSWQFDGNLEAPTFAPSFRHTWNNGIVCHYVLTAGILNFCPDCTHALAGKSVALPKLPYELTDEAIYDSQN